MPRSDDYAAGYRAGVEAAAARCRLLATDMRGFSPWRHYDYVQRQRPRALGFYAIAAAIAPLYDNIASEIEKLLKEPADAETRWETPMTDRPAPASPAGNAPDDEIISRLRYHSVRLMAHGDRALADVLFDAVRALRAHTAQPAAGVLPTDAMVEAALDAFLADPRKSRVTLMRAALTAALAAAPRAGVPEGWRLVPVEPTVGMLDAISLAEDRAVCDDEDCCPKGPPDDWDRGIAKAGYAAMLDAAPQPEDPK